MPTLQKKPLRVIESYDVAADAKKRISLRKAATKHFHVKVLSNGCYVLEPRVLSLPRGVSLRSLAMLEKSVASLKQGKVSKPIDLSRFSKV